MPVPLPPPPPLVFPTNLANPFSAYRGAHTSHTSHSMQQPQQQQQQQQQSIPMSADIGGNSDHLVLQMQINQLQSRLVCIHKTLDIVVGSMNEMMSMMQQQVMATTSSGSGNGSITAIAIDRGDGTLGNFVADPEVVCDFAAEAAAEAAAAAAAEVDLAIRRRSAAM